MLSGGATPDRLVIDASYRLAQIEYVRDAQYGGRSSPARRAIMGPPSYPTGILQG